MNERSPEALVAALAILRRPQLARLAQRSALPRGVTFLLEVAAGEEHALREAQAATGRQEASLKEAASFFVEQVLLSPKSNYYRILGAPSTASPSELRRHMALILKSLHPDVVSHNGTGRHFDKSAQVGLVTKAWDTLKMEGRRNAYDDALKSEVSRGARMQTKPARGYTVSRTSASLPRRRRRILRETFWTRLISYLGSFR
jgi:hypothetical protein